MPYTTYHLYYINGHGKTFLPTVNSRNYGRSFYFYSLTATNVLSHHTIELAATLVSQRINTGGNRVLLSYAYGGNCESIRKKSVIDNTPFPLYISVENNASDRSKQKRRELISKVGLPI